MFSSDVILNILARSRTPAAPVTIMTSEALRLVDAPWADCGRYDELRAGLMERQEILDMMGRLQLAGMRAVYDEVIAIGLTRQHPAQRIVGELPKAEIAEKQARSIKYQLTIARLRLAKELVDFDFAGTPINQGLVRDLATGTFLDLQRNGTSTDTPRRGDRPPYSTLPTKPWGSGSRR